MANADNNTLAQDDVLPCCPKGFRINKDGLFTLQKPLTAQHIIDAARQLILDRFSNKTELTSVEQAKLYLAAKLEPLEQEVFVCIFLDNQHKVIEIEELFRGTIDGASIYPREVVKQALHFNAAAMIVAHNHPSGIAEPSAADVSITIRLKEALALVDTRLLDHFVIGAGEITSLAQSGRI